MVNTYRDLYIEWLNTQVDYGDGARCRVRYPKQYEQFVGLDIKIKQGHDTWLMSDLHFNHKNVIEYSNRPFKSREEMNEKLIENHNEVVKHNDRVIYLGDIAFCSNQKASEFVERLNGIHKCLIVGNHDLQKKKLKKMGFEQYGAIGLIGLIEYDDSILILTHFPLGNLPKVDEFDRHVFNVHGHTHNREEESIHHINVSVEHTEYTPINISKIQQIVKSRLLEIEG